METMKESLTVHHAEAKVGAVSDEDMESEIEHVRSLGRLHREALESRFRAQFASVQ